MNFILKCKKNFFFFFKIKEIEGLISFKKKKKKKKKKARNFFSREQEWVHT